MRTIVPGSLDTHSEPGDAVIQSAFAIVHRFIHPPGGRGYPEEPAAAVVADPQRAVAYRIPFGSTPGGTS